MIESEPENTSLNRSLQQLKPNFSSATLLSGSLWYADQYAGGLCQGISKSYYETGELSSEYPYLDDQEIGVAVSYFKNGELQQKSQCTPSIDGINSARVLFLQCSYDENDIYFCRSVE